MQHNNWQLMISFQTATVGVFNIHKAATTEHTIPTLGQTRSHATEIAHSEQPVGASCTITVWSRSEKWLPHL